MNCIICKNTLTEYENDSFLKIPVYQCKLCNVFVTGDNENEINEKLQDLYKGEYWNERNAELSINSEYQDEDSQGKFRNWHSQYLYCKKFFKTKNSVLEIGVGGGQATFWFENLGYTVTGIEPDARNVKLINKKLQNSRVVQGFIEDITIKEKFDILWMSHVLEHLVRPDLFLKKIKNNLMDDGIFFIEVPSCEHVYTLNASINENPHIFHFTKKSLTKLVEKEFHVISCDCFRPAKKIEGICNKILKPIHPFPFYPRILTNCKDGRDLRIILKKK